MAASLANGGLCPLSGDQVMSPTATRSLLSMMQVAGMKDYSTSFLYKVQCLFCCDTFPLSTRHPLHFLLFFMFFLVSSVFFLFLLHLPPFYLVIHSKTKLDLLRCCSPHVWMHMT